MVVNFGCVELVLGCDEDGVGDRGVEVLEQETAGARLVLWCLATTVGGAVRDGDGGVVDVGGLMSDE